MSLFEKFKVQWWKIFNLLFLVVYTMQYLVRSKSFHSVHGQNRLSESIHLSNRLIEFQVKKSTFYVLYINMF